MLKIFIYFELRLLVLVVVLFIALFIQAQNSSITNRTPEQEAKKQTEKMQKELELDDEQVEKVYELNLKYAKERKETNSRVDAMKRIRKKDEELKKILTQEQYINLKSKRNNVTSVEIEGKRRYSDPSYSKNRGIRHSSSRTAVMYERVRTNDNHSESDLDENRPVRNDRGTTANTQRKTNSTGNRPVRSSRSDNVARSRSTSKDQSSSRTSSINRNRSSDASSARSSSSRSSSSRSNTSQKNLVRKNK